MTQTTKAVKIASELNGIIHSRNLFLVSTGERHIDARVKDGKVVTVGLYSNQEIEYAPAIFRDGYGSQVNLW